MKTTATSPHGLFSEGRPEAHTPDGGVAGRKVGGLPGLVIPEGDDWQVRGLWGHLRVQVVPRTKMNAGGGRER